MRLTTVAALCAAQGTHYYELCRQTTPQPIVRQEIDKNSAAFFGNPLVYCGNVRDVHIFGHSYVKHRDICIEDHQSFALAPERSGFAHYARDAGQRRDGLYTEERECIFIGGHWYDPERPGDGPNFGHFMFEFASRLAIFDRSGKMDLPAVVFTTIPDRWLDFLRLAGVREFITVDPREPPNFANVWVTSCPFYRGADNQYYAWPSAIMWLRDRLIRYADTRMKRRIYMGRGSAKTRRPINEANMFDMLARYGFETFPEMLSAEEQVRWMAEAECIVACQGASPVVTQFAPEHCKIIYLHGRGSLGYWGGYAHAIFLRQQYQPVECARVDGDTVRLNAAGQNELANYYVDLENLERLVKLAIA